MPAMTDRPLAAKPYTSYRYRTSTGWMMIGAMDDADALNEAKRGMSKTHTVERANLQRWDGTEYKPVG
jgi:hypothetical protein